MKIIIHLHFILFTGISFTNSLSAQTIPKEELILLTSEWKGERFADGRPKIPDGLLQRAKRIMIDDGWTILIRKSRLQLVADSVSRLAVERPDAVRLGQQCEIRVPLQADPALPVVIEYFLPLPDHPEIFVVQDEDLDWQLVDGGGR